MVGDLPSHDTALQVVHLDELPEAAGVVVVGRLGIPKSLQGGQDDRGLRPQGWKFHRPRPGTLSGYCAPVSRTNCKSLTQQAQIRAGKDRGAAELCDTGVCEPLRC
jgi:hypothetical protein